MAKVKIGVIGAGGIARRKTLPGLLEAENCELAAGMDVTDIQGIAKEFNVPRSYTRAEQLVQDPTVQAVYIASPVNFHAEQIKLAAAKNKHILCEKPLALNYQEAEEAVAACRDAGVFLQEGYMMKFHGAHVKIRDVIASGRLGRIVYMRAQLSCWYPPIEGAWRQGLATGGGGSLIDMATHLYDLLEFLSGDRIQHVVAITSNLVQDYESEDASTTLLQFAGGPHASVDSFFCIPDESSRTRLEIYGSQGSILAEGTIGQGSGGHVQGIFGLGAADYDATQNKDEQTTFHPVPFDEVNPYMAECAYFADCVINGRPPETNDGDNALHILKVAGRAYESYRQKKILTV
jgi:predicted dehydrogenase